MSHHQSDYELARALQSDLDNEFRTASGDDHFASSSAASAPFAGGNRRRRRSRSPPSDPLNATQNLVHPEWESRDPTPDIQTLFRAFDAKFFQQKLRCVALEWSRRMYQCAGICYYQRNRMGSSITIRLSEPLLKLRQRKDLVETLLHEMIHAYLFVLNIREPNGGHGPNFKRIMVSINKTAGTNITVYHTFHDEVNVYKTHVWKCNGICQHRGPFYGVVKRTCNRAPGPNDLWWAQHKASCGGYFAKISEPEKKAKAAKPERKQPAASAAGKGAKGVRGVKGLDDANNVPKQRIDDPKWGMTKPAAAASSTKVQRPRTVAGTVIPKPPTATAGGSMRNVVGIRDLTGDGADSDDDEGAGNRGGAAGPNGRRVPPGGNLRNVVGFKDLNGGGAASGGAPAFRAFSDSSAGHTLGGGGGGAGGTGGSGGAGASGSEKPPVIDLLRSIWSRKFDQDVPVPKPKQLMPAPAVPEAKSRHYRSTPSTSSWQPVAGSSRGNGDGDGGDDSGSDDDVFVNDVANEVIELNSDSDDSVASVNSSEEERDEEDMFRQPKREPKREPPALTQDERQRAIRAEIKRERIADSDDEAEDDDDDDDDIIFIDDEFDDTLVEAVDAAVNSLPGSSTAAAAKDALDTSVIDDIFGTDTLLADFAEINDAMGTQRSRAEEIITCVICGERMERGEWSEHLNGCLGVRQVVKAPGSRQPAPRASVVKRPKLENVTPGRGSAFPARRKRVGEAGNRRGTTQAAAPVAEVAPEVAAEVAAEVEAAPATAACPSCWRQIPVARINQHLDECLT